MLRIPVQRLQALAECVVGAGIEAQARGPAPLAPCGDVEVLAARGPNGEWVGFLEATAGCCATRC